MTVCHCFSYFDTSRSNVCLYAISDGMGGHNAGEVASRLCVEMLESEYRIAQNETSLKGIVRRLQVAISKINETVCTSGRKNESLKGMGATLVILIAFNKEFAVLNIGDSRAYYYTNHELIQITKDNTEGQRMIDLGLLTRKEVLSFPARKNLNRYVGYSSPGYIIKADEYYPPISKGMIMLCSDGISDYVSEKRIADILCAESDLEIAAQHLIQEAVASPYSDNATVILIPVGR